MGFSHYLRSFIGLFDAYSTPFKVQFLYRTSFQTTYGGFISLILYIIVLAAFIFLYILLHKKEEQNITSFDLRHNVQAQFVMNINKDEMDYSRLPSNNAFFFPAFFVARNGVQLSLEEVQEDFDIEMVYKIRDSAKNYTNIKIGHCDILFPEMVSYLKSNALPKSICIDSDGKYDIQGELLTAKEIPFKYITISLKKKKEVSTEGLQFVFLYTDYSINNKLHDQSPLEFSIKQLPVDIIPIFEVYFDLFLSLDEFHSQDNLYAHWAERYKQKVIRVNRINKRILGFTDEDGERAYITINLRSETHYKQYIRTYKSFFQFISQIGGLIKVLFFAGSLIVVGMNKRVMNVSISNQIYNMINPSNEKNVLQEYQECKRNEEDNRLTAPIFLSLNPILKQLSFEYYRYERNRGMDFSIKEALSKVFCFCFKVKSIEQKDRIFLETENEIEKALDTTTVTRFAQETQKMNDILLKNNTVMLNYMVRQNIAYDTLHQIKQALIQHQIMNSASPMSLTYYKQNFFVNGLITIKNQGDLTKKDLLLIKQMNLNPTLVGKLLISYYDRLQLIYPPEELKQFKTEQNKYDTNNYNSSENE